VSPAGKVVDLAAAAALVEDGDHVAIGGCLYSRTPWAMLMELLRVGRTGLTLSRSLMCYEAELFLARGAATALISSWVGIGLPWGTSKVFRRYVEQGLATYEEWSHLALGLRYVAGAMGVPFLPTRSLLGSDLLALNGAKELDDPFTGERICLVPALQPDVALVHVHRADPSGNAQVDGAPYMDRELAGASGKVIVTTEEIVSAEEIERSADRTLIPGFEVSAVVEVPYGSFPHECYGRYEAWFEHFDHYSSLVADGTDQGVERYMQEFVDGPGSFGAFLDLVGPERLAEQERRAGELVG
jgi:glutaconate CoA-transferase, subunit A